MIEKIHGMYIGSCDICGEETELFDDWYDCKDWIKENWKIISEEQRQKIIERNHKTKGIRRSYKKPITAKQVYDLKNKGYSFNKISQMLNLDWGCVKQRYNDFIYDNPELLQRSDEK